MVSSSELITSYTVELQNAIASIPKSKVEQVAHLILSTIPNQSIYIAGNGGSASTASHFATDLGVGSQRRRNPVRAISLCENLSVLTATSNDHDYSQVFSKQIELLGRSKDIFIAITASGNSENLVVALETAKKLNMTTIGITGFDGGIVGKNTDINIHIPTEIGSYGVVEDTHLALCHIITEIVRNSNV